MAARVRWLSLQLKFHPSLYVIDLATNVNQFRRAVEREERLPEVTAHGMARSLAVWHKGFNILHRHMATDEATALNEFGQGGTFADVRGLLREYLQADSVLARAAMSIAQ